MGMPNNRKSGLLLAARDAISERFGWDESQVNVLLVTGKPTASSMNLDSKVLAANDLRALWELIKKGDIGGARSVIGIADSNSQF